MKKKLQKALRKAYRKGRKDGFDHGFNTAMMIYNEVAADLKREIEELNSEIILGEEEDDVDTEEQDAQKRLMICNKNDNQFQKPYEIMRAIDLAPTIIEAETCNKSQDSCNKAEDDAVNASFPCDTCRFKPPSSCDGKPCTMCDTSNPLTNCYQKAEGENG